MDYIGKKLNNYSGYVRGFDDLKPIDDYNWIGLKIKEVGEYSISLLFEIDEYIDLNSDILVIEIDFFRLKDAASIVLK